MQRAIKGAVLLGCIAIAAMAFAGSQANIPDWVRQAAAQEQGTYPQETKAIVLLDETTYTVNSSSEYIETHRRVVRILRPEGHESEGTVQVEVSKGEKLLNIHAWTIDKAGNQFEVKQKEFIEVAPYTEELFGDIRKFAADAPAAVPGSVVAFEFQVRRHAWRTEEEWVIQEFIPVKLAVCILELPAGWEQTVHFANREEVAPEVLGPGRFKWSVRDVPAIADDDFRPHYRALAQYMSIAFYPSGSKAGTWAEIAQWSRQLAADRRVANADITEKVRQLTAGKTSFDGKARALTNFLQREIRYVAIEIGIGGWQPHFASDTFRLHYGDCKDKATLLSTMLKEAGINSELVDVHTEHGVTHPNVPSNAFNHMILGIELPSDVPDGAYRSVVKTSGGARYVIFDPTDRYTQLGSIRNELQGNYIVMELPTGGELLQIPNLDPESNVMERTAKLRLSADGTLSGDVTERRTGDQANEVRMNLHEVADKERTRAIERYLASSARQYTLGEPVFENLDSSDKDLYLRYKLTARNYGQTSGPLLLVRNRVIGQVSFRLPNKKRSYGVELNEITHIRDVVEIEVPDGFKVDDLPDPAKVDVEFASYQSQFEQKGNMVRYTRDYIVRDPHVPIEKLPALKRLENAIGSDEYASTVLKKAP
jgi:hypothetical protein